MMQLYRTMGCGELQMTDQDNNNKCFLYCPKVGKIFTSQGHNNRKTANLDILEVTSTIMLIINIVVD